MRREIAHIIFLFLPILAIGQGAGVCQKTTDPGAFNPGVLECWEWINTNSGIHFCYDGTAWDTCGTHYLQVSDVVGDVSASITMYGPANGNNVNFTGYDGIFLDGVAGANTIDFSINPDSIDVWGGSGSLAFYCEDNLVYTDNRGRSDTITINDKTRHMRYLQDYWSKPFDKAENITSVQGTLTGWNTRAFSARYKGKYDRTYFLYNALENSVRQARVYWYDYDTESFSDSSYVIGEPGNSSDSHNGFTINVDPDGYLVIVSNEDDGAINVHRSDFAELDNNGAIDASSTLTTSSITAYANYVASAYVGEQLVIDWRGNSAGTSNQESRTLAISHDDGETFDPNLEWLTLDAGHWAYGAMYPDEYRDGVFLTIAAREGSTGPYPKWGIVWTRDFINFGNMEYYATNGESGWSKDVVANGPITDAEFQANIAVINDAYGSSQNHFPPKLQQTGFGHIVIHTIDGTRSGGTDVDAWVTSIYDIEGQTWTHNSVNIDNMPVPIDSTAVNRVAIIPYDQSYMYMVMQDENSNGQLLFTCDGGQSWTYEETLLASTASFISESNYLHSAREGYVWIQNGTTGFEVVRFGEQTLNIPRNNQLADDVFFSNERDVYVNASDKGLVLESPDGTCWRVTVDNAGSLSTSSITCPN